MKFWLLTAIIVLPAFSYAHIRMISPLPRLNTDNLKQSANNPDPCGNQPRMATPYVYEPNQLVTFQFEETINHPGRFLVQFSMANDQGFELPENELARLEDTMVRGMRTMTARMPNVECTTCTVRVVQVMDDQPGELYVHCIDINLKTAATPNPPAPAEPTPPPGGNSGQELGDGSSLVQKPGFGCGQISPPPPKSGPGSAVSSLLLMSFLSLFYLLLRRRNRRAFSQV